MERGVQRVTRGTPRWTQLSACWAGVSLGLERPAATCVWRQLAGRGGADRRPHTASDPLTLSTIDRTPRAARSASVPASASASAAGRSSRPGVAAGGRIPRSGSPGRRTLTAGYRRGQDGATCASQPAGQSGPHREFGDVPTPGLIAIPGSDRAVGT